MGGSILDWGQGNIDEDPIFVGGSSYHLQEGSPCIDAGDPDPIHNDECLPPSMGTERNDMGAYGGPWACPMTCWNDEDSDGYFAEVCGGLDCDDGDPNIHPGEQEVCDNGIDDDCTGGDEISDDDLDGFVDESCGGDDCDDTNAAINPGSFETCGNELDDDCDGVAENRDMDGDQYIDESCGGEDCDDENENVNPEMDECCGTPYDDNCDGDINEGCPPCFISTLDMPGGNG